MKIQNFEMVDEKRVTSTGTASVGYKHFGFPEKMGEKVITDHHAILESRNFVKTLKINIIFCYLENNVE